MPTIRSRFGSDFQRRPKNECGGWGSGGLDQLLLAGQARVYMGMFANTVAGVCLRGVFLGFVLTSALKVETAARS